jgi:hypothetical protein
VPGGDAEQGSEGGSSSAPTVEAKDEFIEIGLKVLAAQSVVDAQGLDLEVGKNPVDPGQHNVSGHLADDMGIVGHAGDAGIAGPAIGFGGRAGSEIGGQNVDRAQGLQCRLESVDCESLDEGLGRVERLLHKAADDCGAQSPVTEAPRRPEGLRDNSSARSKGTWSDNRSARGPPSSGAV